MSKEYAEAVIIWKQKRETKYSNHEIKSVVDRAYCGELQYAVAQAQTAMAMMAYNEMIDREIAEAERTWKR